MVDVIREIRNTILPVLRPLGGTEEVEALKEVIESGWWGKGPKVEQFEKEFAQLVGAKHAIAVTSNTHGLDLVLKAMEIKDADIINPTISFMTTAMVPLWNNCTSNIVDVDPVTMCICPEDTKKNLRKDTKAIIVVNMAGVPAPIKELREFFDGPIIEDCAHSCYTPGAGKAGDVAIWSFQAVKTMPCGDGGMITTEDDQLAEKLRKMTWLGISSTYSRIAKGKGELVPGYSWDYEVDIVGYKCYMIDILAAICLEQMKKLDDNLTRRRLIQTKYNLDLPEEIQRPAWSETVQYYCSKVDAAIRDELINFLSDKKIHTSVHFKPLHKYKIFDDVRAKHGPYKVADKEWLRLISLPVHLDMTDEDIDYIINWTRKFFHEQ